MSAPRIADWQVPKYPADNPRRPTGPLCDGCHSVNYGVKTKQVTLKTWPESSPWRVVG